MRKFAVFVPVLALMMLLASSSSAVAQQSVSITIGPGRDEASGTGTATLTAMGTQTQVVLRVASTNPDMLAHIHADVCPGVGAVVFPLTNVRGGTSTTMIAAPLAQVLAEGRSINLHRSMADSGVYVGCGNLAGAVAGAGGAGAQQVPGAAVQMPRALPATGDLSWLGGLLGAAGAAAIGAGIGVRRWRRR
jgi:LPXTG-motif cell wall-anchored protein